MFSNRGNTWIQYSVTYFIAGWSACWCLMFCVFVVDTLHPPAPPWLWVCLKIFTFTSTDMCRHGMVIHIQRKVTFLFAVLFTGVKAQSPHKNTDYRTILAGLWTLSKSKLFTTTSNICSFESFPPRYDHQVCVLVSVGNCGSYFWCYFLLYTSNTSMPHFIWSAPLLQPDPYKLIFFQPVIWHLDNYCSLRNCFAIWDLVW
jgi:hypothetical protein